jgi:hypothetical protein
MRRVGRSLYTVCMNRLRDVVRWLQRGLEKAKDLYEGYFEPSSKIRSGDVLEAIHAKLEEEKDRRADHKFYVPNRIVLRVPALSVKERNRLHALFPTIETQEAISQWITKRRYETNETITFSIEEDTKITEKERFSIDVDWPEVPLPPSELPTEFGEGESPATRSLEVSSSGIFLVATSHEGLKLRDMPLQTALFVGRSAKDTELSRSFILEGFSKISSEHLIVRYDGKTVTVMDCNSTNGTYKNHTKLEPNKPVVLTMDDVLWLCPEGQPQSVKMYLQSGAKGKTEFLDEPIVTNAG